MTVADEKRFPILQDDRRDGALKSVPWALVEPLRDVADQVHGQTLERLAQRGGLARFELGALLVGVSCVSGPPFRVLDGQQETMPALALLAPTDERRQLNAIAERHEARAKEQTDRATTAESDYHRGALEGQAELHRMVAQEFRDLALDTGGSSGG